MELYMAIWVYQCLAFWYNFQLSFPVSRDSNKVKDDWLMGSN